MSKETKGIRKYPISNITIHLIKMKREKIINETCENN